MLDAAENGGPIALATRRTENTLFLQAADESGDAFDRLQAADESGDAFDRVLEEMTRAKLAHKAGIMKNDKSKRRALLVEGITAAKKAIATLEDAAATQGMGMTEAIRFQLKKARERLSAREACHRQDGA